MEQGKTILIVDDSEPVVMLLKEFLRIKGFSVLSALSGMKALNILQQSSPDLVLLDLMMPGMDGYEVLSAIRKNKKTSHLRVFMLTACSELKFRQKAMDLGADGYLTKPVNLTELGRVLESVNEPVTGQIATFE